MSDNGWTSVGRWIGGYWNNERHGAINGVTRWQRLTDWIRQLRKENQP